MPPSPQYAALSYCWGTSTPFITTSSTLAERCNRISILDMPPTLREAVQVARDLDIRYLWIDALCIIQGRDAAAQADWAYESGRMNGAYTNANLTIVAAASTDCIGGLIDGERTCTVPYRGQNGSSTAVLGMNGPDDITPPSFSDAAGRVSFNNQPICNRAWTYQEWILSSRLLVFTTVGIYLVCGERELPTFHIAQQLRLPRPDELSSGPFYWSLVVHDFCAKRMTNPTDKLPAIAGLAQRFHEISGGALGRYYAGLWEVDLAVSLLWRVIDPVAQAAGMLSYDAVVNPERGRRFGRGGKARAPSWSWAAVDGPLMTFCMTWEKKKPATIEARVVACETNPAPGHDSFGQIEFGRYLRLY
ncbi:heterokaryon incompatibility protein-domain-containing protein [Podospora appendiculata]|uniref:Heterokaryon incompatibility protein-domain-containing protein n=1 Tax=Podospora appendiculata TaxID=314037 RepID=A0AAE0XDV2_9PEZI|nr:heterokaryon incompatibility protein-domain-containing protein [Podospora appendiculata]